MSLRREKFMSPLNEAYEVRRYFALTYRNLLAGQNQRKITRRCKEGTGLEVYYWFKVGNGKVAFLQSVQSELERRKSLGASCRLGKEGRSYLVIVTWPKPGF